MAVVLVKAGEGFYTRVKFGDVAGMDRADLLKALKHDEVFVVKLRDVALDDCAVHVCASASDEEPRAEDGRSTRELKGARTLGDLFPAGTVGNLFIHVQLKAGAGAGASGECLRACPSQPDPCRTHTSQHFWWQRVAPVLNQQHPTAGLSAQHCAAPRPCLQRSRAKLCQWPH